MTSKYTNYTESLATAVDRVCSTEYENTFKRIARENGSSIPHEDVYLLAHCPNTISWYDGERRTEIIDRFRSSHMNWYNEFFNEEFTGIPPYKLWNGSIDRLTMYFDNLFFRLDIGDKINSQEIRTGFQRIVGTVIGILRNIVQFNPVTIDPAAIPLVRECLQIVFYSTLDDELAVYLKSLNLVHLMNELIRTSNDDNEIHLHAYRILAVIMAEDDIKNLQNAHRIASVFVTFIDTSLPKGELAEGRLHNILRSLRVLAQHDEIREELIKQDAQKRLSLCILNEKSDSIKAKIPSLEILLAMAFNKDFAEQLKMNVDLMNYIRTLASKSDESDLQRVATGLIWKLEKENEESKRQISPRETSPIIVRRKLYDIMISYSHSDKELCHRIVDDLVKEDFRVWIDSQLMHGTTFDAMANAIENSEFVLLCMSDAYKQSAFCQMEANYALKRRCQIIPLVMTLNYRADGWLGILTSPYIYVDFPKHGYQLAFDKLKKQIQLIRNQPSNNSTTKSSLPILQHDFILTNEKPSVKPIEKSLVSGTYPHCLDSWTCDDVKRFLREKDFDCLLPVLEEMNGSMIHQTYQMCRANPQGMFLSLKDDLLRLHRITLTLKDYLTFLDSLKIYVPIESFHPTSTVCNLM